MSGGVDNLVRDLTVLRIADTLEMPEERIRQRPGRDRAAAQARQLCFAVLLGLGDTMVAVAAYFEMSPRTVGTQVGTFETGSRLDLRDTLVAALAPLLPTASPPRPAKPRATPSKTSKTVKIPTRPDDPARKARIETVYRVVAKFYKTEVSVIRGRSREPRYAVPSRQMVMAILSDIFGTLAETAREMGLNHSTVDHGSRRVHASPERQEEFVRLSAMIRPTQHLPEADAAPAEVPSPSYSGSPDELLDLLFRDLPLAHARICTGYVRVCLLGRSTGRYHSLPLYQAPFILSECAPFILDEAADMLHAVGQVAAAANLRHHVAGVTRRVG